MEIVDELTTPGCPNCAVKHLSAALASAIDFPGYTLVPNPMGLFVARAFVNLVEAKEGYSSHHDYAIGLLVEAEEAAVRNGVPEFARRIRSARTALMTNRSDADAIASLWSDSVPSVCVAHVYEAARELPSIADGISGILAATDHEDLVARIIAEIARVRNEYFDKEEKGGADMATKKPAKPAAKKAAAKPNPFAAQAACRAGKSKKCK